MLNLPIRNPFESKPEPKSGHELCLAAARSERMQQARGLRRPLRPDNTEVRRELAPDFIAQSHPDIHIGDPGSHSAGAIGLPVYVGFDLWLQNEPLRHKQVDFRAQPRRDAAGVTDIECELRIESVRRNAHEPEAGPGT